MSIINEGEILARVHKFKLFRTEGNLFVDLYEAILGEPGHKFIAVPNLLIQEADKKYFGVGDSKGTALKDCLDKIKDVPIHEIVHLDSDEESDDTSRIPPVSEHKFKLFQSFWKLPKVFSKSGKSEINDL